VNHLFGFVSAKKGDFTPAFSCFRDSPGLTRLDCGALFTLGIKRFRKNNDFAFAKGADEFRALAFLGHKLCFPFLKQL
jgi:hypothetical protein